MSVQRLIGFCLTGLTLVAVIACGGSETQSLAQQRSQVIESNDAQQNNKAVGPVAAESQPAAPAQPAAGFDGLPAPSEITRSSSAGVDDDRYCYGRLFEQPANAAKVSQGPGQEALFTTSWTGSNCSLADLGYATYVLNLPKGYVLAEVMLYWGAGDVVDSDIWFALGNVQQDRWEWFSSQKNIANAFSSLDPYIDDTHPTDPNRVLLVVALTGLGGSTNGELLYVRLGDNIFPTATFTITPGGGVAPLNVAFDPNGSADVEGSITCSWDFDDDGTFELTDVDAGIKHHTYTSPADYSCNLVVSDNEGRTANLRVSPITVTAGGQNPIADLQADRTSIRTGSNSTVNFDATGSTDDGTIEQYEFDFTDDGTYDETNTTGLASQSYNNPGTYTCLVRVTDDEGLTDTDTVDITVSLNAEPVFKLDCDTWFGDAPVNAVIDASRSYDPDGTQLTYLWDMDLDGVYELDTGTVPTTSISIPAPGTLYFRCQICDEDGATLNQMNKITADDGPGGYDESETNNNWDEANLLPAPGFSDFDGNLGPGGYDGGSADWFKFYCDGDAVVTIDMSISDAGADLDLALFDQDGTTALTASANGAGIDESITWFLHASGFYYVLCLQGSGTSNYELAISQVYSDPPSVSLVSTPNTGTAPLYVLLSMDGSTGGGSAIAGCQWDFDGDGFFDIALGPGNMGYEYLRNGVWNATLKVTNTDGAWSTAAETINISAGVWDEVENNDVPGSANTLAESVPVFGDLGADVGYGAYDGDSVDWWSFTPGGTGSYTILMSLNHAFGDLDLELYQSDGTTKIDESTGVMDAEEITAALTVGTTYYIKCYLAAGNGSGYKLRADPTGP